MYVCMYVCTCMYVCMYVCMYLYVRVISRPISLRRVARYSLFTHAEIPPQNLRYRTKYGYCWVVIWLHVKSKL